MSITLNRNGSVSDAGAESSVLRADHVYRRWSERERETVR
jgi:hypothetical protein